MSTPADLLFCEQTSLSAKNMVFLYGFGCQIPVRRNSRNGHIVALVILIPKPFFHHSGVGSLFNVSIDGSYYRFESCLARFGVL